MKQQLFRGMIGLLAFLFATASIAAPTGNSVVHVQIEPDAVYFTPMEELERGETTLTVSGPEDCFVERDYKERETGFFKIFDDDGEIIPDGQYKFKVTFRPTLNARDRGILASARKRNDPKEIKELKRQGIVRATLSDSGYFQVANGKFVFEDEQEDRSSSLVSRNETAVSRPASNAGNDGITGVVLQDFVVNDDLIIDGSACIGFDCVNGEVFGFDTIRIKENNLRIKFDDTSVAASFPRNDWQLTANDSANGGASKFSIDDISGGRTPFTVEANARSHSLYVDDGGRIGNRTNTPSVEIHTVDGDTPTLRLEQDGSSGFAPQTWDVAGNETNFFLRDVTNGSTLPFRIRPGAPTNSIFIDDDGDVGLGTGSPDATSSLHVVANTGTANDVVLMVNNGPTRFALQNTASSGGSDTWRFNHADSGELRIADGVGGSEVLIGQNGDVTITGQLITTGPQCAAGTPCDGVFDPDFEVESIEDHAAFMWTNKHLPAVGPTQGGTPLNLSERSGLVLNELEKAHIYIEQLHSSIRDLRNEVGALKALETRLEALELQ